MRASGPARHTELTAAVLASATKREQSSALRIGIRAMVHSNSKFVGIWIDHGKAVLVSVEGEAEKVTEILSNVEGHVRLKGGSPSVSGYGHQDVTSESQRENRYNQRLRRYYRSVIDALRNAKAIFIFGPGEAKMELRREILKSKELATKLVGTQTTDKMTDNQIRARVRDLFKPERC